MYTISNLNHVAKELKALMFEFIFANIYITY